MSFQASERDFEPKYMLPILPWIEENRLYTNKFAKLPEPWYFAKQGWYYDGGTKRLVCYSCGERSEELPGNYQQQFPLHKDDCEHVNGSDGMNIPMKSEYHGIFSNMLKFVAASVDNSTGATTPNGGSKD